MSKQRRALSGGRSRGRSRGWWIGGWAVCGLGVCGWVPAGGATILNATNDYALRAAAGAVVDERNDFAIGLVPYDQEVGAVSNVPNQGTSIASAAQAITLGPQGVGGVLSASASRTDFSLDGAGSSSVYDLRFSLAEPVDVVLTGDIDGGSSGGGSSRIILRVGSSNVFPISLSPTGTVSLSNAYPDPIRLNAGSYRLNAFVSAFTNNTDGRSDAGSLAFQLDFLSVLAVPGDYNGSGSVEQGDLDLVLNNWGGPRPSGAGGFVANAEGFATANVDQEELDRVLNNWGGADRPNSRGVVVPEPALMVGCFVLVLLPRTGRIR